MVHKGHRKELLWRMPLLTRLSFKCLCPLNLPRKFRSIMLHQIQLVCFVMTIVVLRQICSACIGTSWKPQHMSLQTPPFSSKHPLHSSQHQNPKSPALAIVWNCCGPHHVHQHTATHMSVCGQRDTNISSVPQDSWSVFSVSDLCSISACRSPRSGPMCCGEPPRLRLRKT